MSHWWFRAHLAWRRGWIEAAHAKKRREESREALRRFEQRKRWLRWRAGGPQ